MAKDKKTVTNAMRLLNASKIKYETVEYEADEVGEHFGEAIAEMTGIPHEKYGCADYRPVSSVQAVHTGNDYGSIL